MQFVVLAALCLGGVGCFGPSEEAEARLQATKADGEALINKFDGLEERFVGNQANVKFYAELKSRHETVSAVACGNNDAHYNAMVESLEKQTEKARLLKRNHLAEGEGTGRELARLAAASKRNRKGQQHD